MNIFADAIKNTMWRNAAFPRFCLTGTMATPGIGGAFAERLIWGGFPNGSLGGGIAE